MAQDMGSVSSILMAFKQTIPLLYQAGGNESGQFGDVEIEYDLPIIQENVKSVSMYMKNSAQLFWTKAPPWI